MPKLVISRKWFNLPSTGPQLSYAESTLGPVRAMALKHKIQDIEQHLRRMRRLETQAALSAASCFIFFVVNVAMAARTGAKSLVMDSLENPLNWVTLTYLGLGAICYFAFYPTMYAWATTPSAAGRKLNLEHFLGGLLDALHACEMAASHPGDPAYRRFLAEATHAATSQLALRWRWGYRKGARPLRKYERHLAAVAADFLSERADNILSADAAQIDQFRRELLLLLESVTRGDWWAPWFMYSPTASPTGSAPSLRELRSITSVRWKDQSAHIPWKEVLSITLPTLVGLATVWATLEAASRTS